MLKIVVMAAIPQEYAHLRKTAGPWLLLETRPFKRLSCFLTDREIILIEAGMGGRFAAAAFASVVASKPDLLIFAGFAGGLHPDLAVGDVCVVQRTMTFDPAREGTSAGEPGFLSRFSDELAAYFYVRSIRPVTAVTVKSPPNKKGLSSLITGGPAVVDMETAELTRIAVSERIPFLCLRSISDSLYDELGFDLSKIIGNGGKVDPLKVVKTIIQNPPVVRAFYRSWLRSRRAGKNLGEVLAGFIRIPSADLKIMAGEIRTECNRGPLGQSIETCRR